MAAPVADSPRRALVIGAGVIGLSLARELLARGWRVRIFEARRAGSGASGASVGVLQAARPGSSALARLVRASAGLWPGFSRELEGETGIDIGYREPGAIRLLQKRPRRAGRQVERWREVGVTARWAPAAEALDCLPPGAVATARHAEALVLDAERVVAPARLVEALAASCRVRGARLEEECGAGWLELDAAGEVFWRPPAGHPRAGELARAAREASCIVLAAGAWSSRVAERLPEPAVRVTPVRGQALELDLPAPRGVVHFEAGAEGEEKGYYLVPRGDRLTWVGSTVESAGFDEAVTPEGREELLAAARELLPGLAADLVLRHWAGLRPRAGRRGGPFLGPWRPGSRLWLACGHYRSGVLLAPATARLLAEGLEGRAEISEAFSPRGKAAER